LVAGPSALIARIALVSDRSARIATASARTIARVRNAVLMVLVRLRVKGRDRSVPVLIVLGLMAFAAVVAAPSVVPDVPKALGGLASAAALVLGPPSRTGALIAGRSAATAIRPHPAVR
jgi:hypothetical protein